MEHAGNNSFDNVRRVKKGPGSLDDCDEEAEDHVDRQTFIKGIIGDKHLVGDSQLSNRKSIKENMRRNDDLILKAEENLRNTVTMGFDIPKPQTR